MQRRKFRRKFKLEAVRLVPPRRRLDDESRDDGAARHARTHHGDLEERQARQPNAPFGPGEPIYEQAVPAADGRPRHHLLDEPAGQCGNGELLLLAQDRLNGTHGLQDGDDVFDYTERFYNTRRRHWTPGYLSPVEFEERAMLA